MVVVPAPRRSGHYVIGLPVPREALPYYDRFWTRSSGEELHMAANSHRVARLVPHTKYCWTARYLTGMRGRNVVLFGDSNLEPAVATLLERGVFRCKYDLASADFLVQDDRAPGQRTFARIGGREFCRMPGGRGVLFLAPKHEGPSDFRAPIR
jgi:hypothetical protein